MLFTPMAFNKAGTANAPELLMASTTTEKLANCIADPSTNGFLRMATTIGGNWWGLGFGGQSESVNDVYVLDNDLKIAGSVLDLGKGERIYSVRFLQGKGYLVTFKQTDPFFVLDLSDF